jgi:hypothetical protein
MPVIAPGFLPMYSNSSPNARVARQSDRGRKEGSYPSHHLHWLTRGIDLLIGYVDLRYGSSFQ